jgi:hypothetical protein
VGPVISNIKVHKIPLQQSGHAPNVIFAAVLIQKTEKISDPFVSFVYNLLSV